MSHSHLSFRAWLTMMGLGVFTLLWLGNSKLVWGDFSWPSPAPAQNGAVSAAEYSGNSAANGSSWYMTWDNSNLYVGISGANVFEGAVLYIDTEPQIPVNGGTNSNGTMAGFNYDGTSFAELPFRANFVTYIKNGYREYRTSNGAGGWSGNTSGYGTYGDNGSNVREIAIPWSVMGGRPTAFNWFGYVTSGSGFVYGELPAENGSGFIGPSAREERYFTVSNTADGSSTEPFSRNSYVFNRTTDATGFGAISVWDFTMNDAGLTISRGSGAWTVGNDLLVSAGTITFNTTTDPATVADDLTIGNAATLTLSSAAGGDLNVGGDWSNSGTYNGNNRAVTFNGTTAQTIGGSVTTTFDYLTIGNSSAAVSLATNTIVDNLVTINGSATLSIGANSLTLQNGADLTNNGTVGMSSGTLTMIGTSSDNPTLTNNGTFAAGTGMVTWTGTNNINGRVWGSVPTTLHHVTLTQSGTGTARFGVDFYDQGPSSRTTINGTLTLNLNAFVANEELSSNGAGTPTDGSPFYGSGSVLKYNNSGSFDSAAEWLPNNVCGAAGVPAAVQISNNSSVNISAAFGAIYGANSDKLACGTLTIDSGSTLVSTAGTLSVQGDWSGTGNFTHSNGTVRFNGISAQMITSARTGTSKRFNHLQIESNVTANFSLDLVGNLVVTSGDSFAMPNGILEFQLSNSKMLDCDGMCSFDDLVVRTVDASSSNQPIDVNDDFTITTASATFIAPANMALGGDWSNAGIFSANSGTITLDGSNNQSLGSSSTTFYNLMVNNSSPDSAGISLLANHTIQNSLTLTDGLLKVGSSSLTMGSSATINGGSIASMVITDSDGAEASDGFLCKQFPNGSSANPAAFSFPVGDTTIITEYSPANIDFDQADFSSATVCLRVTDAKHPNSDAGTNYLTRYWTMDNNTGVTNIADLDADFNYPHADIVGDENDLYIAYWDRTGSDWNAPGQQADAANNLLQGNNLSSTNLPNLVADLQGGADFSGGESDSSLPVTLSAFRSTVDGEQLRVMWQTATELGNVGFNLYLATASGRQRLNTHLISSHQFDSTHLQNYEFVTKLPTVGQLYLEDVDFRGQTRLHGPFGLEERAGTFLTSNPINWTTIAANQPLAERFTPIHQPFIVTSSAGINLSITKDGIYRLTHNDLLNAGIDLIGTSIGSLVLTQQGQPVPLLVNHSGTFHAGTVLEFYGQGRESLYNRTNVYTLRVNGGGVWANRDATMPNAGTPAPFYLETVTYEQENSYSFLAPNGDPWYDTVLMSNGATFSQQFPLTIDHYLTNIATATLTVDLWGLTDWATTPDHQLQLWLNGTLLADVQFDGLTHMPITADVPASLLQEAENSLTLTIPARPDIPWDMIILNRYSLTYPRAFVAQNGSLTFTAAGNLFRITNLPWGNAIVYRLGADGSLTRLTRVWRQNVGDGTMVVGFAGTSTPATYIVTTPATLQTPPLAYRPPTPDITSGTADYLIISHPDFNTGLAPLIAHHEAQGLTVKLVNIADIYANFSHDLVDPQALRDYLTAVAQPMGIQYILLVGGDSYDYLDHLGLGSISFIPTLYTATQPFVSFAPADPLFADINGDNLPDLPIGRLPVRTPAELETIIGKTLAYHTKNYAQTALLVADQTDGFVSFSTTNDQFANQLSPEWQTTRAYLDTLSLADARSLLLQTLNQGVALTSFLGHSGPNSWTFAGLFQAEDLFTLTNVGRPTVVTQWGCWNSYHVDPAYNTLAHQFLLAGDQGAAAVLGAATITQSRSDEALGTRLMPLLVESGLPIGLAIQLAKADLALTHPELTDVLLGWTLLGDPALVITP